MLPGQRTGVCLLTLNVTRSENRGLSVDSDISRLPGHRDKIGLGAHWTKFLMDDEFN